MSTYVGWCCRGVFGTGPHCRICEVTAVLVVGGLSPNGGASLVHDHSAQETENPKTPKPKRLGRRIIIGLVCLVILSAGVHWARLARVQSRLQAQIDRVKRQGHPIFLDEFVRTTVPIEHNAARIYQDAYDRLQLTEDEIGLIKCADQSWIEPDHQQPIAHIIDMNSEVLDLVRRARSLTGADWQVEMRRPTVAILLPDLAHQRRIGHLLSAAAAYHFQNGNHREAVQILMDTMALARAVDQMPFFISHLGAAGIMGEVCLGIEYLCPKLKVSKDSVNSDSIDAVPVADLRNVIAQLLDTSGSRDSLVSSCNLERMSILDMLRLAGSGKISLSDIDREDALERGPPAFMERARIFLRRPSFLEEAAETLDRLYDIAAVLNESNWPAMVHTLESFDLTTQHEFDNRSRLRLSSIFLPSMTKICRRHFLDIARRRMAATALAIRLYECDHGQRPAQLSDLVPSYLPNLPVDPFDPKSLPIRYAPTLRPARLYSVSLNGIDDEGRMGRDAEGDQFWDRPDLVFYLNSDRPRDARRQERAPRADTISEEMLDSLLRQGILSEIRYLDGRIRTASTTDDQVRDPK